MHNVNEQSVTVEIGGRPLTISTGKSVFVQDTIDMLNSKLTVTPAVSYRQINRDFTNYASNGSGAGVDYKINKTYSQALPSLSSTLQFTPEVQGFAGVAKNFKAPGNFEYFSLAQGVTFTNGVGSSTGLAPLTVNPETSTNLDVGLRFRGDAYRASATAFLVKFKDRIASSYDPNTGTTHDWNVGNSTVKGMESIKNHKDIFNGPPVSFGPNIRQGANSSFLAEVKGGRWTRVTEPLGF